MDNKDIEYFEESLWFPEEFWIGFSRTQNSQLQHDDLWRGRFILMLDSFWDRENYPKSYNLIDCINYCNENNLKEGDKLFDYIVSLPGFREENLRDTSSISTTTFESWGFVSMQIHAPKPNDTEIFLVLKKLADSITVFDNIFIMSYKNWIFNLTINFETFKIGLTKASLSEQNKIKDFSYDYTFESTTHFETCISLFDSEAIDKDWFDIIGY